MPRKRKDRYDLGAPFKAPSGKSYTAKSVESLVLWLDFASTLIDRTSNPNVETPTLEYQGSVPTRNEKIEDSINFYNIARFDNSENLNALATYDAVTNPINFGDGTTDKPFSVSLWYRRSGTLADTTTENLFYKGDTSSKTEYQAYITMVAILAFQVLDESTGAHRRAFIDFGDLADIDNIWMHLVFTYDGSGTSAGIKIYRDGALLATSTNDSGTYTAMEQQSTKLFIGASHDGSSEADGDFAEFAIWARELPADEISAIYNATTSLALESSGIVNSPIRSRIREMDSRIGMYPTIGRTGDRDRKGFGSVLAFDDRNTQLFGAPVLDDKYYPVSLTQNFSSERNYQYGYSSAASLIEWFHIGKLAADGVTPSVTVRKATGVQTVQLVSDPIKSSITIGNYTYDSITFDDTDNSYVRLNFASTDNTLTFGDGSDDTPFTFSWIMELTPAGLGKLSNTMSNELFAKSDGTSKQEYYASVLSNGQLSIVLMDESSGGFIQGKSSEPADKVDFWSRPRHVVVTYDGSTNNSGIKWYVDGVLDTGTPGGGGSYTALEQNSDHFYFATNEFNLGTKIGDLKMAELAVWGAELTPQEVQTVYNFITKPIFKDPGYILDSGTCLLSGGFIANQHKHFSTPNQPGSRFVVTGNMLAGVADNFDSTDYKYLAAVDKNNESITAFNEAKVILKDNEFYLTGTSETTFPGFSGRLHDKTQIQIDLSTSESTKFGYTEKSTFKRDGAAHVSLGGTSGHSTLTLDGSNVRTQLMVYWNDTLKRWEKIAKGVGANTQQHTRNDSNISMYKELGAMIDTAAVGFGNCSGIIATSSVRTEESGEHQQTFDLQPESVIKMMGKPTSVYGFPSHGKFHATGSQTIKMSDYIDRPVVLEKCNLQFSAKLQFADDGGADHRMFVSMVGSSSAGIPSTYAYEDDFINMMPTFFMLRQFKQGNEVTYKRDFSLNYNVADSPGTGYGNLYGTYKKGVALLSLRLSQTGSSLHDMDFTLPGLFQLASGSDTTTYVDTNRDLVTFGQINFFAKGQPAHTRFNATDLIDKMAGDAKVDLLNKFGSASEGVLWQGNVVGDGTTLPDYTGSYQMDFPCRTVPVLPPRFGSAVQFATSSGGTTYYYGILGNEFDGGRTLALNNTVPSVGPESLPERVNPANMSITGRSLTREIAAFDPGVVAPLKLSDTSTDALVDVSLPSVETIDVNSPYILFPEDEIVLGWQYPMPSTYGLANHLPNSIFSTGSNHMVLDGPSTLTLFCSQIKNNVEYHDTLNQPLTSEVIHESIHYDNPVIDQWQVSLRGEYTGSYLDDYSNNLGIGTIVDTYLNSGNQLAGSFQRFVRCSGKDSVLYDSMVPDPLSLWSHQTGISPYLSSSGERFISFGLSGSAVDDELVDAVGNSNADWFRSFVYNNKINRVPIKSQVANLANTVLLFSDGKSSATAFGNTADQKISLFKGFNFNGTSEVSAKVIIGNADQRKITQNNLMWLYGVGSGISGSLNGSNINSNSDYVVIERPIGYKYGVLSVLEQGRSNVFRYDKYGNFADMLEQSIDTRMFKPETNTLEEGPIKINFVTDNGESYKVLTPAEIHDNTFNSSNLDLYATSSLPFFDDDITRNRIYKSTDGSELTVSVVSDTIT